MLIGCYPNQNPSGLRNGVQTLNTLQANVLR